ncbi:phage baseplate plug family protein [Testudinibacter sp. P80/BLE/0925]
MMIYEIPLQPIPAQRLSCSLGGQNLDISLTTRLHNQVYISIFADSKPVVINRLCLNLAPIIGTDYLPINGNLVFADSQGHNDPEWSGLGSRYKLYWGGA